MQNPPTQVHTLQLCERTQRNLMTAILEDQEGQAIVAMVFQAVRLCLRMLAAVDLAMAANLLREAVVARDLEHGSSTMIPICSACSVTCQ